MARVAYAIRETLQLPVSVNNPVSAEPIRRRGVDTSERQSFGWTSWPPSSSQHRGRGRGFGETDSLKQLKQIETTHHHPRDWSSTSVSGGRLESFLIPYHITCKNTRPPSTLILKNLIQKTFQYRNPTSCLPSTSITVLPTPHSI